MKDGGKGKERGWRGREGKKKLGGRQGKGGSRGRGVLCAAQEC